MSPYRIWIADANGRNQRPLTRGDLDDSPTWSPDGRRIAFARLNEKAEVWEVWIIDRNGRGERRLTRGEVPAWSPNGRTIAFWRNGLRLINPDGSRDQLLYRGAAYSPDWSPDGRTIVFDCSVLPRSDRICSINVATRKVRVLTHSFSSIGDPDWSPDGRQIAFSCREGDAPLHICVMNADGSGVRRLTATARYDDYPDWSPDGRTIAFARTIRVDMIFVMHSNGTQQSRLIP